MRPAALLLDRARSPRVAAWATALCALLVLGTLTVGGFAASLDTSRVAGVTATSTAGAARCTGPWCTVSWTVTATEGPVRLDRVVLPELGLAADDTERRLLGVDLGGESLTLPSREIEIDAARTNAIVAIQRTVAGGTSVTVNATVAVARGCPPGGAEPVTAVLTVSSGGIVDQRRPDPVALPCP